MASKAADTGCVQVLHYLKRNPKFTRDQFWAYWKDIHGPKLVPLAQKYGFTQYQQVRCARRSLLVPLYSLGKTHSYTPGAHSSEHSARLFLCLPLSLRQTWPVWS